VANIKSQKKRILTNAKRADRNKAALPTPMSASVSP
jgi:ribosomal protein S20